MSFTGPDTPTNWNISDVETDGFNLTRITPDDDGNFEHFIVLISPSPAYNITDSSCSTHGSVVNCTFHKDDKTGGFWVTPLENGTQYKVNISTEIGGMICDEPLQLSTYTGWLLV